MRIPIFALLVTVLSFASAIAESQLWVKADAVNRRTCPSTNCGIVGKLFFRESATVYEMRRGWGRITKYYDAACVRDRSDYVDSGNAKCTPSNGIESGKFAEWLKLEFLSRQRPADPGVGASGTAKLIASSDDFRRFNVQFVKAAEELISSGQCSGKDFEDQGGWTRSTNKGAGTYFTYCRNGSDRIYLNVSTGRIFR